ncbi:glycosyltransferase family 2 protein [Flavobacterium flavipallidum]|uniref:Glycosyltransferase n=1 Tax=Flavobacterium flavipallidum TaxID=3139140 RepID=A0ABU9HJD9_9FLAO
MKLSIIIPVYNTESYLKRCLDSVFSQDLSTNDFEVIVINDGSTDNSLAILEDYERKHENLVLLSQENQGEAVTRNKAIEISKGVYIAFVDSDDAIYDATLLDIVRYIDLYDLDLLYLNIHLYDEKGNFINKTNSVGDINVVKDGLSHPRRTFPATIYRRSLIQNIKYPQGIMIGPDTVFNVKAHFLGKKISYWDVPYYKYTQRPTSLSKQGRSDKAYQGFVKAIIEITQFEKANSSKSIIENQYFKEVYLLLITRIVELNIIPNWDKVKYTALIQLLDELQIRTELAKLSSKYKYIDKSFYSFKYYQNYLGLKSILYKKLISSNK